MAWLQDTAVEVLAVSLENGSRPGWCWISRPWNWVSAWYHCRHFFHGQLRHAVRMSGATALVTDQPTLIREQLADLLGADVPHLLFENQTLVVDDRHLAPPAQGSCRCLPVPPGDVHLGYHGRARKGRCLAGSYAAGGQSLVEAVAIGANDRHLDVDAAACPARKHRWYLRKRPVPPSCCDPAAGGL